MTVSKENKKNKVVIISDCTDISYNELYQTLCYELDQNNMDDVQIAPLVPVKNFSIENTAFAVRIMAEICSPGTIFLVVVNGTNNNPERIFGRLKNGIIFVGNNSGYFNWLFDDVGIDTVFKNNIDRTKNKKSFGGKHVQAPTVAKLLSGIPFQAIGEPFNVESISNYKIPIGTVVHCDNFGLMKIMSPKIIDLNESEQVNIFINGEYKCKAVFSTTMKSLADGTWVLFPGSSLDSIPELGKVRSRNSAAELGVQEGDVISWEKIF